MAQTRFWNYKADDKTLSLNERDLILIPHGLYCGFDAILSNANMNLVLDHTTTNKKKVDINLNLTNALGIWKSKQGVIVVEDAQLTLPITGGNTQPRIDLVVAEHEYIAVAGGTTAIYKIILGTPAANPVAPALTSPNKQIILGTLRVPASVANAAQCTYTKSIPPDFGESPDLVHKSLKEVITGHKTFNGVSLAVGQSIWDDGGDSIELQSNHSYFEPANIPGVGNLVGMVPHPDMVNGQEVFIKIPADRTWEPGGGDPYSWWKFKAGDVVQFRLLNVLTNSWLLVNNPNGLESRDNNFGRLQTWASKGQVSYNAGSKTLFLPNGNNFIVNYGGFGEYFVLDKIKMDDNGTIKHFPIGSVIDVEFYYDGVSHPDWQSKGNIRFDQVSGSGDGQIASPYYNTSGLIAGNTDDVPTSFFLGIDLIDLFQPTFNEARNNVWVQRLGIRLRMGAGNKWTIIADSQSHAESWMLKYYTNTQIASINNLKANKTVEAWKEIGTAGNPSYVNGWTTNGAATNVAKFRKNDMGMVSLMGGVANSALTAGTVLIFTLPVGYRPTRKMYFAVAKGNGSDEQQTIEIDSNGNVSLENLSPPATEWAYLDGIHFYV